MLTSLFGPVFAFMQELSSSALLHMIPPWAMIVMRNELSQSLPRPASQSAATDPTRPPSSVYLVAQSDLITVPNYVLRPSLLLLRLAVVARRRRALRRDFAQSGAALLAIRKRA